MSLRRSNPTRHSLVVIAISVFALAACGGSNVKAGVATTTKDQNGAASDGTKKTTTASFRAQLLTYAKCMRDNGVRFPDPQFDSDGRPQFNRHGGLSGPGGQGFAGLSENPTFEKGANRVR